MAIPTAGAAARDYEGNESRGGRDEGRGYISPVPSDAWPQHQGNGDCVDDAHRRRQCRPAVAVWR